MTPHGPWTILSSQEVYRDPWVKLRRDEVLRPDGKPGSHVVVHLKPGISVLPLDKEGYVYLTDEFHYAVGRNTWEVVSGGIEPGEDPLLAAQRELQEELGFEATEWIPLGSVDPFTSVVDSPARIYLARGLTPGVANPEGTEIIRPVRLSLEEAVQHVMDSRITHGPTCVLILKAWKFLCDEQPQSC